jgi:hypothetical protein
MFESFEDLIGLLKIIGWSYHLAVRAWVHEKVCLMAQRADQWPHCQSRTLPIHLRRSCTDGYVSGLLALHQREP